MAELRYRAGNIRDPGVHKIGIIALGSHLENHGPALPIKRIKTTGIGKILAQDREKWICPKCDGVIHFQTKTCSECGTKF